LKISVIIPTYNRRDILARTLPTVLGQDFPHDQYEIIIVIDGSTDGTREYLRTIEAKRALQIIDQPNKGLPAARNAGIGAACGEIVLFIDDDLVCEPNLLKEHVSAHESGAPGVVSGLILGSADSSSNLASDLDEQNIQAYVERMSRQTEPHWPHDAIVYANNSVALELLQKVGGFDERFYFAYEEVDLGLRLWDIGARFSYCSTAVAHHLSVKTSSDLVHRDAAWYGRSEVLLCRKHPAYRPHSRIADLLGGPRWKRNVRQFLSGWPRASEAIFGVPTRAAERGRSIPRAKRVGMKLVTLRQQIAMLGSAAKSAGSMRALRREFGMQVPALMYHRIGPALRGTNRELTLSPAQFERQIRWLAKLGYVGIRPSDWVNWCKSGSPLPPKPVLITIDDGYADLCDYALPILRCYGFSAVVYVVTDQIGGTNLWDQKTGSAPIPIMAAEQIRYWSANGIEFGCHTRTHPDLTTIAGAELEREIVGSRDDLEAILGSRPVSFAYPFGMYNQESADCARRNFDLVVTCDEGRNQLAGDPQILKRSMVYPIDTILDVAFRVILGWNPIERARTHVRLRTRIRSLLGIEIESSRPYPLA